MKIKWMTPILAGLLLAASGVAFGAETDITGSVDLTGRVVRKNNSAKLVEYRDLNGKVFGDVDLNLYRGSYYLDLLTTDMGLDTQSYLLKGGSYQNFKYSLYYNETPHNYSFGARTYLGGVGTPILFRDVTPSTTNSNLWNVFDYAIKRQDFGANVEVSLNSPFYFSAGVNQTDTKGTRPFGISGQLDAPEPIDYRTQTLNLETGYRTKKVIFAIDGMLSKFDNASAYMASQGASGTTTNYNALPSDNDYWRVGGQLAVKLPLQSTLALKGGYAKLSNTLDLVPPSTGSTLRNPTNVFSGDIRYTSLSAALTSNPIKPLDAKLFYNYLNKSNKSTTFDYGNISDTFGQFNTEVFDYKKNNVGLNLGYKLPFSTKIQAGYEYLYVKRTQRLDATTTSDHISYVQLKNSYLDTVSAKVKYQHVARNSDFENENGDELAPFVRRYDATDKTQDVVKVGVDVTPVKHLELGVEYAYKVNNYDKTILGRTKDTRHEVLFDAKYELPELAKFTAYFDYERVVNDSTHRKAATAFNPDSAPIANTDYNWTAKLTDDNYAYGVGVEVPVIKHKLDLMVSWNYEKADGRADFTTQGTTALIDIPQYDDYTKKSVNTKAIYHFNKNLDLSAGYYYARYDYNDISTDNYPANFAVNATNFLSGAYKDHDYEAHVGYLTAAYKF